MTTCTVCIATYKRMHGLSSLLGSLEQLTLKPEVVVDIVVVDNDPESARSTVEQFAATSRYQCRYLCQPEQNISLTRNVAVAAATGELIWFVDDDERAFPSSLSELIDTLNRFDADGVFGSVLPEFVGDHPDWILTSSAFNRAIHPTGQKALHYRTSNTLVRTSVLRQVRGPFDIEYGLSGGSDSMLFRQLEKLGATFVYCSEGSVVETVPESRSNWPWMRERFRRQGQNYARQTVTLAGSVLDLGVAWMLLKAAVQVLAMSVLVAVGKRYSHARGEAHLRLWTNIGKFEGVAGAVTTRSL